MHTANSNMPHLDALGLDFNPFPVVPDAHNYFTTEGMNTAISDILHCIDSRKGFILISGEVGLGKTTLSRLLLLKLAAKKVNTALILNTFLQSGSLLKAINKDFNIHIESNLIEDQLEALNNFLLEQYVQEKNCVIVIDDAQQLNLESLELIRQLSNLETNQNKLLQIILVAQGEILTTLSRQDMRQLKSRIALNIKIEPFTVFELKQYIQFRLARAGSSGQIDLENKAYKYLHKVTQGLPRQINLVMDRCLYVVAAYGINKIDVGLVRKAYDEIRIDTYAEGKSSFQFSTIAITALILILVTSVVYQFRGKLFQETFNLSTATKLSDESLKTTKQNIVGNADTNLVTKKEQVANLIDTNEPIKASKTSLEIKPLTTKQLQSSETEYLSQFGLTDFEKIFSQALEKNDFQELAQHINDESDYKILFGNNTSLIESNTDIWTIDHYAQAKWLTFWKPQIILDAFYQGYYSENIYKLQSILHDEGYYKSNIDGIVGEKTIKAIAKLQTDIGIDPSGFPDQLTLYYLQNDLQEMQSKSDSTNEAETRNKKLKSSVNKQINRYALDNSTITD